MYSVSERFLQAIRSGAHPITRADIIFPGQGLVYEDLPVSDGRMSISAKASYRGSGNLTIPDPTLAPVLNEDSPLNPYGYELIVKVGLQYSDGVREMIPMGIYQIETATVSDDGVTDITFFDRAKSVERADFVAPKDYSGWLTQDAIEDIILYAAPFYPGTGVEWTVSFGAGLDNPRLPGGTVFDTGRWQFVEKLIQGIGAEAYFDRDGNAVVQLIPAISTSTPLSSVDWEVNTGTNGVLISTGRAVTRSEVANGVVVIGSGNSTGAQPFGFATDDDPASRTYFEGPFGKSIRRVNNSTLTTNAQCLVAAQGILKTSTGLQRSISFQSLRNPALDPSDILLISHLDGTQDLVMLDEYSFSFAAFDMSGSIRSIQYVEV